MEADDAGFLAVLEVAGDGVADHRLQFFESIGFRENRKAERARLIAAFREFLHGEVDFALGHVCYPSLIICRVEAETRPCKTAVHAARDDAHKPCRCSRYQNESARGLCSEKAKKKGPLINQRP